MKQGNRAILRMKKNLCAGGALDEKIFFCSVLMYDSKRECIYLVLEDEMLTKISLDAIYECQITTSEYTEICTGRVRERYYNEFGKILQFEIKNGFYKNNVKSVDKQMA